MKIERLSSTLVQKGGWAVNLARMTWKSLRA